MKKFLLIAAMLGLGASSAHAYEDSYDKGWSSATVTGVNCTSGTAVNITGSTFAVPMNGFRMGGYRIQNQHASCAVWIGYNGNVSTSALSNLGVTLTAGKDGTFPVGYNPDTSTQVQVWCRSADACGANGATLSREGFGYK